MIEQDKEKVLGVLKELSNAMTRIQAEKDFMKEAISDAAEKYELEKKHIRKMAQVYHKQNFDEIQGEAEEFCELYESITTTNK
jgi:hypothetical protein